MTTIAIAKIGAAIGFLLAIAIGFFHLGSLGPKADLANYKVTVEAQQSAQLAAVAKVYENQVLAAQADHAHMQGVIDDYDAHKGDLDPISTGLAHRVYVAAAAAGSACSGVVPQAGGVAGRAQAPSQIPGGDPSIIGRIQDVIDACTADADQLNAMVKLAP